MNDMEEKLNRGKSTIFQYFAFYKLCTDLQGVNFIGCDLTFREIMRNTKEIKELYKDALKNTQYESSDEFSE